MIDPSVLARQRSIVEALDDSRPVPPRLRLVKSRNTQAPPITCECGVCRKCRKREAMRRYRACAVEQPPKAGHVGPRFDKGRACDRCGDPIADQNRTGFCSVCQKHARAAFKEQRKAYFFDGGGI